MRPIVKADTSYQDLIGMFGSDYEMPPMADFEKGDEILNIKCHLCGDRKIPVYAGAAARKIR